MTTIRRFFDWLLGPRCSLDCQQRVFPRDVTQHLRRYHGGTP